MSSKKISEPTFYGKRIGGYMYAHINALSVLPYKYRSITEAAIKLNNEFYAWNVVKLSLKDGVIRQSLTCLKAPQSHKSIKRRFETTQ